MMNKAQWITAGVALLLVIGLYAATSKQVFGPPRASKPTLPAVADQAVISTDSILYHAKEHLTPEQVTRLNMLENSISRGDVRDQQLHVYHQLSSFWRDSARVFAPFAWYTAEAARLENSEKSLTFAAHLFLNSLLEDSDPEVKAWEAAQAQDLFERSLKLNPSNDSSKVGLGSVYVYGGVGGPMKGISLIKEVADRDSTNAYAQWTLGQASLYSGQLDKAADRFKKVLNLQPGNREAVLLLAEVAEQQGHNAEAIEWYNRLLPLIRPQEAGLKTEVEARIAKLKK